MATYTNISGAGATTLISQSGGAGGNISKILIVNTDSSDALINLYLESGGGSDFYLAKGLVIPQGVSVVFEDNLSFNSALFALKLTHTHNLTVIIS